MNSGTVKTLRLLCAFVFVGGIAGMIVSSIAGNNEGWVLTFGGTTALAAVVLLAATAVTRTQRVDVFSDALAERIEERIAELVAQGADEQTARQLVKDTISLVRGVQ